MAYTATRDHIPFATLSFPPLEITTVKVSTVGAVVVAIGVCLLLIIVDSVGDQRTTDKTSTKTKCCTTGSA